MISISKAMKQGRHDPDLDMFVRHSEGLTTRQNSPKNADFGSQVIRISKAMKQGRHAPDFPLKHHLFSNTSYTAIFSWL